MGAPSAEVPLPLGTLFIADLHLDPLGDARVEEFVTWITDIEPPPRLVVLGDLFDVWVGPAQARLAGSAAVLAALEALAARGVAIEVVPGNRDFLFAGDVARRAGTRVHADGFIGLLEASGAAGRALFVHGDELCTHDRAYQRMKRVLRSAPVRWLALRLPLGLARWAAGRLRRVSTRAVARKPAPEKAMQPAACRALAAGAGASTLVCGHAHEYREEALEDGPLWIVLDAWGGASDALRVAPGGELRPLRAASLLSGGGRS